MPVKTKSFTVPAHKRIGLENLQGLQKFWPAAVQQYPKQALSSTEPHSFTISVCNHGQLLPECKNLHVQHCPASKQAKQGCEQWVEYRIHFKDSIDQDSKLSSVPTSTEYLVGTGEVAELYCMILPVSLFALDSETAKQK